MTFNHLLSLSFAFHMKRKTGEILRILDRGSAINRVFELLLFNICPTIIDICIALGVFVWKFGWELALVVGFVMIGYSELCNLVYASLSNSSVPHSYCERKLGKNFIDMLALTNMYRLPLLLGGQAFAAK